MTTFAFSLGRNQLTLSLGRKRGRPKRTFQVCLSEFISQVKTLIVSRRYAGHPLSRVLRRVFEHKKIREVLGFNLAFLALFSGILIPPISAFDANPQAEVISLSPGEVEVITKESLQSPLASLNVSQGYRLFHPAVDLDEELGAEVYPIMNGQVEEVVESRFGYGKHILINHGSGIKSLYAHLNQINVIKGEEVTTETVIGTVGSTGWATGAHLHLEIYENGRTINPLTVLH